MNQNSNSQGNLVVLLIPYFFSTKKSDVCPARIQPSLKKTFKRCGVIILGYFAQCNANSIPPPPSPPPHRTDGFSALVCYPNTVQCFFIRMLKDPSPTLHSFLNNFLAWWTSFIDTARNTLLNSVKLPSLRAICQSKTNLDNIYLQSKKILQLLYWWKWWWEFVLPPPPHHHQQKTSLKFHCDFVEYLISPHRIKCITFK